MDCSGQCGVDQGLGNAHSGANNGWVRNTTGWNDVDQTVPVTPNTEYTLTGWLRTSSDNNAGYFGVRTTSGTVIGEDEYNSLRGYTQVTVNLDSGNNRVVVVYGGLWAQNQDTWMQMDDVFLTPSTADGQCGHRSRLRSRGVGPVDTAPASAGSTRNRKFLLGRQQRLGEQQDRMERHRPDGPGRRQHRIHLDRLAANLGEQHRRLLRGA